MARTGTMHLYSHTGELLLECPYDLSDEQTEKLQGYLARVDRLGRGLTKIGGLEAGLHIRFDGKQVVYWTEESDDSDRAMILHLLRALILEDGQPFNFNRTVGVLANVCTHPQF